MVHQHFELIPPFTALENVVVGLEGKGWWMRMDRHAGAVAGLAPLRLRKSRHAPGSPA
jgi:ABC-type uncharacterized transport system ATPase subunit